MALPSIHHWKSTENPFFKPSLLVFEVPKNGPKTGESGPENTDKISDIKTHEAAEAKLEALKKQKNEWEDQIDTLKAEYRDHDKKGDPLPHIVETKKVSLPALLNFEAIVESILSGAGKEKPTGEALKILSELKKTLSKLIKQREDETIEKVGHLSEMLKETERFKKSINQYNSNILTGLKTRRRVLLMETKTLYGVEVIDFAKTIDAVNFKLNKTRTNQKQEKYLKNLLSDLALFNVTKNEPKPVETQPKPKILTGKQIEAAGETLMEMESPPEASEGGSQHTPGYKQVSEAYVTSRDQVGLGFDSNGDFNKNLAVANRAIFMAVVKEKTDGFDKEIDHDFDVTDYKANIKNHPMVYREWLSRKDGRGNDLTSDISALEREVRNTPTPPASMAELLAEAQRDTTFTPIPLPAPDPDKTTPNDLIKYWEERIEAITKNHRDLKKIEIREDDTDKNELLDEILSKITRFHLEPAKKQLELAQKKQEKETRDKKFVKPHLAKDYDFMQAMMSGHADIVKLVDQRVGLGDSMDQHNVAVRALVIARFHQKGISPQSKKGDDWTVEQIMNSEALNHTKTGTLSTSPLEKKAIEMAFVGGSIHQRMDEWAEMVTLTDQLISKNPDNIHKIREWAELIGLENPEALLRYDNIKEFLEAHKETLKTKIDLGHKLLEEQIKPAIKNPSGNAAILEKINEHGLFIAGEQFLSAGDLDAITTRLNAIEIDKNTFKREDDELIDAETEFKKAGIDLSDAFDNYEKLWKKDPDASIDHWDDFFNQEPERMAAILEKVISPTADETMGKNRRALIEVVRNPNSPHRQLAKKWITRLKGHIEAEQDARILSSKEVKKMKQDMKKDPSLKKEITKAWRWIGRSHIAIKAFLAFIALKWGAKIIKMEGAAGIGGLIAAGGLVGGIAYEDVTGERLLNKYKGETMSERAAMTFEGAITEHSKETMNKLDPSISPGEHVRAQIAMREAPFHKMLEWHDVANPKSRNYNEKKAEKLYRRLGLNDRYVVTKAILPEGMTKKERTQQIMLETMNRTIEFVGNNRGQNTHNALIYLNRRYVEPMFNKDPEYPAMVDTPVPDIYEDYHNHPERMTVANVMQREVRYGQVKKNINKEGLAYYSNSIEGWIRHMWDYSGDKLDAAKDTMGEFIDSGMSHVSTGADYIKMTYKENEWTIKHYADGTWGLMKDFVSFGPRMLGKEIDYVLPKAKEWMDKGVDYMLGSDGLWAKGVFDSEDILGENPWQWDESGMSPKLDHPDNWPIMTNTDSKQYEALGNFQYPFWKALKEGADDSLDDAMAYYTQMGDVDYLILEVNKETAQQTGEEFASMSAEIRFSKMRAEALNNAVDYYTTKYPDVDRAYFEKNLVPITTIAQSTPPESIFVAYFLPSPNSDEGRELIASGEKGPAPDKKSYLPKQNTDIEE